jgi:hypothetical protein
MSISSYMSTQEATERLELLQGTLDLLILRTLIFGPQHGQGIARAIQQTSEEELLVEHGALYPALQRLEERGWISAKWGVRLVVKDILVGDDTITIRHSIPIPPGPPQGTVTPNQPESQNYRKLPFV